jgi:hypothetical protein
MNNILIGIIIGSVITALIVFIRNCYYQLCGRIYDLEKWKDEIEESAKNRNINKDEIEESAKNRNINMVGFIKEDEE